MGINRRKTKAHFETKDGMYHRLVRLDNATHITANPQHREHRDTRRVGDGFTSNEIDTLTCEVTVKFTKTAPFTRATE